MKNFIPEKSGISQFLLPSILFSTLLCSSLFSSCGKWVGMGDPNSLTPGSSTPNSNNSLCGPEKMRTWLFQQEEIHSRNLLDLLLVVDTSASLNNERPRIALDLPSFVQTLPANSDYQIAVMLAHGGASPWSGTLYSPNGVPRVLASRNLSSVSIQNSLKQTLTNVPSDQDEANGEMMLYSLSRGLAPTQLAETQRLGFFRPDALLSVIFISDENDICYPPQLHGYTQFPDYVPSIEGFEEIAYKRYCIPPAQSQMLTPDLVLSRLQSFKYPQPVSLAGIIHTEPSKIPPARRPDGSQIYEDAIGHGVLELAQQSPNGKIISLTQSSYALNFSELASVVTNQLKFQTLFSLSGGGQIQKEIASVKVDGKTVKFRLDPSNRTVELGASDAGKEGSKIEVTACVL